MSRRMSVFISRFLNDLGYSPEMVKFRQQSYATQGFNSAYSSTMKCGSKREGLSLPFENDYDEMTITKGIECYEQCENNPAFNQHITFQMVRLDTTAQGYVLLHCVSLNRENVMVAFVQDSLVEIQGQLYLSSDSWRQSAKEINQWICSNMDWGKLATPSRDNEGPSSPFVTTIGGISGDLVSSIQCHCPALISTWRTRQRLHEWPSPELIETVSSMDSHVVPIGYKDSPVHFLEWRICFTKGEIRLIESLNDCQTKLIVILKLISKHVLKPICKEITSYTMKNLVMWMAEKYPARVFVENRLMSMLRQSLKLLKKCINNKKLPSYMIQDRNLLADRLSDDHAIQLCLTIDMLLHEGPRMLFRCPKIRDGLNTFRMTPEQFYQSARIRRRLEPILAHQQQFAVDHVIRILSRSPFTPATDVLESNMRSMWSDPSVPQFSINDMLSIMPDMIDIILKGEDFMKVYLDRVMKYLS